MTIRVVAHMLFFVSGRRLKTTPLKTLPNFRLFRITPVDKGVMASVIDRGAGRAARRSAISMCATSPSRDKQYENNVCRLRKDKVFVYFT
jgi:hypothetical protein